MATKTVIATRQLGKGPPLPPRREMARNLLDAATGTVRRVIIGQPVLRSAEHQQACLEVCTGTGTTPACEGWLPEFQRCSRCGCFGAFKKWLAASKCPLGKWPEEI